MFDRILLWSHLVLQLFIGRFLITVLISMLVIGLLRFSISSWFSFGKLYFSKNCPFLPHCPFYWHTTADSSLLWSFVFLCCLVMISPFSFLILLIWFLSLCFLMSLANGLSVLFIFSKNQLLVLLIFTIVSFLFQLFML